MARSKPKPPAVVIHNLEQAEEVLREMCQCTRAIEIVQAEMNSSIDAAKAEAKAVGAAPLARLAELEESLAAYASYHGAELFATRKSVSLAYGTFGLRKTTEIKPQKKHTWATILEKLKSFGMLQAVRTKEEVNKELLHEWPDERLDAVGACRKSEDKFWVQVDQAALEASVSAAR